MKASEHLALCEGKRGGASAEERVLCAELEAAEARCKQATGIIRFLKTLCSLTSAPVSMLFPVFIGNLCDRILAVFTPTVRSGEEK